MLDFIGNKIILNTAYSVYFKFRHCM